MQFAFAKASPRATRRTPQTSAESIASLETRPGTASHPARTSHRETGRSAVKKAVSSNNSLFFTHYNQSRHRFLLNTGADVSVLPASTLDKCNNPKGRPLSAANSSKINTYGTRKISLQLCNRAYEWFFHIAAVERPLLGPDLLHHKGLFVDVRHHWLIYPEDFFSTPLQPAKGCNVQGLSFGHRDGYAQLLTKFPSLTTPTFSSPTTKQGVVLHIPTTGPPVRARACRLPPDKLAAAKEEFQKMEEMRIAWHSNSCWSSPLHIVDKADGSKRACGD